MVKKLLLIFLSLIVLGEAGFLIQSSRLEDTTSGVTDAKLKNYAEHVLSVCSKKGFPPSCYDEEIPKLMDSPINLSMEDAFAVTRVVQGKDSRYLYCHVLAHNIAANETKKNLDNWKDVITHCPYTMCNNGCSHGALMERFKNESLTNEQIEQIKPELPDICEPRGDWHPRNIEISMCYHAMGHLHMYMTNADINASLKLCEFIGKKEDGRNYIQTCEEGVFMQIFQPLEPEDEALVKDIVPQKNEISAFCSPYKGEAFDACHREAWVLSRKEIETPEGFTKYCSYSNEFLAQKKCYSALMNIITVNFLVTKDDLGGLKHFCTSLPKEWIGECFSNAARRLMQIDPVYYTNRALEVCRTAETVNEEHLCYQLMAYNSRDSFQPQSQEFVDYCNKLPGDWKKTCLSLK